MPAAYSQEIIDLIIKEYNDGKSIQYISKQYHKDKETIKKCLEANNIIIRPVRKHFFNEDFFSTIDTESKAYWLGFIYADGSVTKTDKRVSSSANRLTINISAKDKELIVKFLEDINSKSISIKEYIPKNTYSTNPMARTDINSTKICLDLEKLGVFKNKTCKLIFPRQIPTELYRHFIRGFFDGDGSITKGPHFSIISNNKFLSELQMILIQFCQLNETKLISYPHKQCDVYNLKYGGKLQVERIFHFLYDDSSIYLSRKYEKFKNILGINN